MKGSDCPGRWQTTSEPVNAQIWENRFLHSDATKEGEKVRLSERSLEDVTVVYFRVDVPEGTLEEIRSERSRGHWDGGMEDRGGGSGLEARA